MSEWKETEIGEFADLINGFAFKSEDFKVSKLSDKFLPILKIKNVANGDANFNDVVYHEYSDKLNKYVVKNNDILIALTGNHPIDKTQVVGGISRYTHNENALLNQRVGKLISRNKAKLNEDFLYYFFKWNKTQCFLGNQSSGSASQANISKSDVLSSPVSLPDIDTQMEIAKTLSNLDQKITFLRQQNQDLEELAQTLFKRWFVDFEFPNKNGEPYKSSGGKMVESELGEIPEGWRVGDVSNHVKHSTVSTSPCKQPRKEFFHYSIPAYDNGRFPTVDLGTTILSNKYLIVENSILVSKLNPSTSRIWPILTVKPNAVCSTEIQVFIPKKDRYSFSFGLFHYQGVKNEMAQRASGTSSSHQRVRPGDILNIECIVPDNNVLELFEVTALRLLTKVEENHEEIQTLIQLRDTLLPKLMSGELRVNI